MRNTLSELSAQKALSEKPSKENSLLEQRRVELSAEADAYLKEVDRLRTQVKQLKGWLEEEIARLVKYKVHLVGDISSI